MNAIAISVWFPHAKIFFQTEEGVAEYRIAAFMKADVRMFPFQQAEFSSMEGLRDYLVQAKALSMFKMEENDSDLFENDRTAEPDQVLTLVTCSYEWKNARNIIVAVKEGMVE